jgi:hypothetical protein
MQTLSNLVLTSKTGPLYRASMVDKKIPRTWLMPAPRSTRLPERSRWR